MCKYFLMYKGYSFSRIQREQVFLQLEFISLTRFSTRYMMNFEFKIVYFYFLVRYYNWLFHRHQSSASVAYILLSSLRSVVNCQYSVFFFARSRLKRFYITHKQTKRTIEQLMQKFYYRYIDLLIS